MRCYTETACIILNKFDLFCTIPQVIHRSRRIISSNPQIVLTSTLSNLGIKGQRYILSDPEIGRGHFSSRVRSPRRSVEKEIARIDLCSDLRSEIDSGESKEDVATDEPDKSRLVYSGLNFKKQNKFYSKRSIKLDSFMNKITLYLIIKMV